MKKLIVMIGNTAWGMHKFRSDLMIEMTTKGHKVIVLAPFDQWASDIERIGCQFIDTQVDRKGTNPVKDFLYFLKLLRLLFNLKPDIVLSYTIKPVLYGTMAAKLAGIPQTIAITTGLGHIFSKKNLVSKVTKVLYKFSLLFASQVWFLNSEDLNTFLTSKLVTRSKAFILPGEGVDVNHFSPQRSATAKINFTLISRMLWDKGVGIFAECAEEIKQTHPNLNFLIVGPVDEGNPEGIPATILKNWHDKGIVSYLGSVNDIRPILQNTTCLVHPTYYKEGIPRILMEANSMGVPCITTNIPGCRDVIQNGHNGFLIRPNNKDDLKKAILDFSQLEESKRSFLANNAREKIISNYSSARINSIYIDRLAL